MFVRHNEAGEIEFYTVKISEDGDMAYESFYAIDEREVATRRGLIRWIHHLCEKRWVTTAHIMELIDLAHALASKK